MKKILMLLLVSVMTLGANAQFEKGTHYVNASLSGFGIGFSNGNFNMGLTGEYDISSSKVGWWVARLASSMPAQVTSS